MYLSTRIRCICAKKFRYKQCYALRMVWAGMYSICKGSSLTAHFFFLHIVILKRICFHAHSLLWKPRPKDNFVLVLLSGTLYTLVISTYPIHYVCVDWPIVIVNSYVIILHRICFYPSSFTSTFNSDLLLYRDFVSPCNHGWTITSHNYKTSSLSAKPI